MPAPAGQQGFGLDATGKYKSNLARNHDCCNCTAAPQARNQKMSRKCPWMRRRLRPRIRPITTASRPLGMTRGRHESRRSHCWTRPNQLEAPEGQHAGNLPRSTRHRCVPSTPRQKQGAHGSTHSWWQPPSRQGAMPTLRPSRNRVYGFTNFKVLDPKSMQKGLQAVLVQLTRRHGLAKSTSPRRWAGRMPGGQSWMRYPRVVPANPEHVARITLGGHPLCL